MLITNIKRIISNKYSYAHFNEKDLLKFFKFLKKIQNLKFKESFNKQINYHGLELRLLELTKKKVFTKKEKNEISRYYLKFNVNLRLKQSYDKFFKKSSNKNCQCRAYIFLGSVVIKLKNIPNTHKLNCLLKIIDLSYIHFSNLNQFEKKILKQIVIYVLNDLKNYI